LEGRALSSSNDPGAGARWQLVAARKKSALTSIQIAFIESKMPAGVSVA
jgi:hypothetical protein